MFALIESCPELRKGGDWPTRMAAVAVHVLLTAAAVAATRHLVERPPDTPFVVTPMTWPAATPQPAVAPSLPGPIAGPDLPIERIRLPVPGPVSATIPPPGAPLDLLSQSPGTPQPGLAIAPDVGSSAVVGAALDERGVDQRPEMLSHPPLDYPPLLREAGVEGRVLVEAVLDTLGRAEPSSLCVISGAHPLFDREAMAVVLGSRYRPGRVAGSAVRVRIRVPVAFTLRR